MNKTNLLSKRNIIVTISIVCMFFFRYLPVPTGMTRDGLQVLGVFLGSLLLWLFVSIDWTSLLTLLALSFVPSLTFSGILTSSFGNSTFAFLLFGFICTAALAKTSFIRRIAIAFITSKLAKKGPWHFAFFFFTAIILIGCFISPSVLFVVCLPILEEIYQLFNLKKGDTFASMLMIGLVCCCGISSGMTPIGHVYGPLAMGAYQTVTGNSIDYLSYMSFAIPVGILSYLIMLVAFRFIMRPDTSKLTGVNADALKSNEAVTKREIVILIIFALVVLLWVAPSFIKTSLPSAYKFINSKTNAFPPLVGLILMSVFTSEGKPLLPFNDVIKNNVSWPALIMCAGTLALGAAMTNADVALTTYLSNMISPITNGMAPILLIILFTLWTAIQTNLSSNIVTITVVSSIAIPVLLSTNGAVSTPAMVSIIGMMGGYAFAAPPAMPSVAISIGSGWVDSSAILKYGSLIMLISVIITIVLGYPIATALMGY